MGRRRRPPCCDKVGLKKGPWTPEEDKKLVEFLGSQGADWCWRDVAKVAGLRRCGKSCRLRWTNYLRPDLKKGLLSEDEVQLIIDLHSRLGNRWSKIAAELPGRTDNDVKNYWNTRIKRKLIEMGIDPKTHLPLNQQRPPSTTDAVVTSHLPSTHDHLQQQPEASLETTPDSSMIDGPEWSFLMDSGGVAGEFAMLLSGSTLADDRKYSSSSWRLKCEGLGNEEFEFEFGFLDEMG